MGVACQCSDTSSVSARLSESRGGLVGNCRIDMKAQKIGRGRTQKGPCPPLAYGIQTLDQGPSFAAQLFSHLSAPFVARTHHAALHACRFCERLPDRREYTG